MYLYQAVDSNDRQQRALRLIDMVSECEDELFSSFCDALITDGQTHIVDNYLRRDNAAQQQQQTGKQRLKFVTFFVVIFNGTVSLT